MLLGRVQVAREGNELRPRKSLEVRGSLELQNGGLTALEDAWMIIFDRGIFLSSLVVFRRRRRSRRRRRRRRRGRERREEEEIEEEEEQEIHQKMAGNYRVPSPP